jgi:hypothetical protein
MYDTSGSHGVCCDAPAGDDINARIGWLRAEVARVGSRRELRRLREEERALSIRDPLRTEEAYAWFGTFLGLLPPFALFGSLLRQALSEPSFGSSPLGGGALFWLMLFLLMNAVCCLVGRKLGALLGRKLGDPRKRSWPVFVFSTLLMGVAWGVVTGAAGGAICFLIGAVFGVVCAVPVALAAFPVFASLHRLLSHGGMIEAQDLWPLAFGVPAMIAALILSPAF